MRAAPQQHGRASRARGNAARAGGRRHLPARRHAAHGARAARASWPAGAPSSRTSARELPEAQRTRSPTRSRCRSSTRTCSCANWRPSRSWASKQRLRCPGSYHTGLQPRPAGERRRLPAARATPTSRSSCTDARALRARACPRATSTAPAARSCWTRRSSDIERKIRDQLARMLGAGGFDPARDIRAITVNRWPHGYAYQYNSLFDRSGWRAASRRACARASRFGRIFIANSDADAYAYTDARSTRRTARWGRRWRRPERRAAPGGSVRVGRRASARTARAASGPRPRAAAPRRPASPPCRRVR